MEVEKNAEKKKFQDVMHLIAGLTVASRIIEIEDLSNS